MNMIVYQKANLKVAEILFDEPEQRSGADIIRYHFRTAPVSHGRIAEAHTLWIDLTTHPDVILDGMQKQTRYEIRRAAQEAFIYEFQTTPTAEWTAEFFEFYDRFAALKALPPANRVRLSAMREHAILDLSRIRSENGTLVWHAHLRGADRVRLLHSASLFRVADHDCAKVIGRANRLHHWHDFQRFHSEGIPTFDFGGWYAGTTDDAKLRINVFKQSFGGTVVRQFNANAPGTWRGSAALAIRSALRSLRGQED